MNLLTPLVVRLMQTVLVVLMSVLLFIGCSKDSAIPASSDSVQSKNTQKLKQMVTQVSDKELVELKEQFDAPDDIVVESMLMVREAARRSALQSGKEPPPLQSPQTQKEIVKFMRAEIGREMERRGLSE